MKEQIANDKLMAENRLEQILEGIQNQDREAIKAAFSKNAISGSEDIEKSIDYLFDYFQGTIQSYEWSDNTIGPISDGLIDHGKVQTELKSWFDVYTDKGMYVFFLLDYPKDTFDPNNVGLYSLCVVKEEEKDTRLTFWQDMKIVGIYIPEK